MQLLAPRLSEMGQDESEGFVCDTTWPGMNRAASPATVIYTYPGDGRTEVRSSEVAYESPFVPGDFVGLPQGTRTGPHLYVLADGPWGDADAQITAASLTGPDGPVEVRWVDNTTGTIGDYMPTGGIVIPVAPLRRGSVKYTAAVSLNAGGAAASRTWTFTTVKNALPAASFKVTPSRPRAGRDTVLEVTATDADGTIASQTWDVRDDGRSEGTEPTLTYRFPLGGLYKVRLAVTDNDGGTAGTLVTVAVAGRSLGAKACAKLAGRIAAARKAKHKQRLRTLKNRQRKRCGP
jgi:hypothetical protein